MAFSKGKSFGQRPNRTILGRTLILMVVCGIVAFSVLAVRLYKLMIIDHDYYEEKAVSQQTRSTTVSASRGTIYDANGNILAMSATAYTVFISPYEIKYYSEDENSKYGDDPKLIAEGLSEILGVDYDSIMKMMEDTSSWYKTVAVKIESELADEVRAFKSEHNIVGIHIENDSKRYYPYGSLACHVIGFVGTDNYGLEGIEALYDDYLEGTDGSVVRLTTSNGTEMLFENYENYNDAIDGSDIVLTLDVTIQNIAEKYLAQAVETNYIQNGGCVIVMNVKTGEILALANANDYDLNEPWTLSADVQEEIDSITDDEERSQARSNALLSQWRNMAISDTYEPGSVFKIITMAMGLEENVISESSTYYCGGTTSIPGRATLLNCWKHAGHGMQTLREAAMHSCNIAFANISMAVGADTFYDYVDAFGLFEKTGIDLQGESNSQWWPREDFTKPGQLNSLTSAAFGQTFNVTPIQMITAMSAAVNGGYLMEPYVVKQITAADGEVLYSKEPTVVRQVISEETSKTVCSILESVVNEEGGTGKNAQVSGYRVGGKTGTTTKTSLEAATGVKEYMVSFCGIAPMDDPEIAVLLVLDNPLPQSETGIYVGGGQMAAPFVGKIISEVLPYLGVEPIYTEEEKAMLDVGVPRVLDSTVESARSTLEELGLSVRVVGEGSTVTDQLPSAGAEIAAGSQVIIYADGEKNTDEVSVPNLYGMTVSQARAALQDKGLFLNTSGASPTSSSVIVSRQSIESGDTVPYGTVIEVTLVDNSNLGSY
ncbi:MAG: penicillin-binding transpeptidase domain-containing protein [Oscillospiraceae bacterium]